VTIKRTMVLASGGIDSLACLIYYKEFGHDTEAIFIDYGHPANILELKYLNPFVNITLRS